MIKVQSSKVVEYKGGNVDSFLINDNTYLVHDKELSKENDDRMFVRDVKLNNVVYEIIQYGRQLFAVPYYN